MGSKLPAAVVVRISKGGRHDLGAAVWLSTRASSLKQGSAGRPVQLSPKLVEHIGSGSTRLIKQLSPYIACTAVAAPSVRSRVLVSAWPFASMARRGCRASCSRSAKYYSKRLVISMSLFNFFSCCSKWLISFSCCLSRLSFRRSIHVRQRGLARPELFMLGDGPIALRVVSLSFRSILGKPQYQGH